MCLGAASGSVISPMFSLWRSGWSFLLLIEGEGVDGGDFAHIYARLLFIFLIILTTAI